MYKVAVVGDKSSVLAFRALGVDVYSPVDAQQMRNTIDKLARDNYGVIYITEQMAQEIPETIGQYKSRPLPAIILIPNSRGTLGIGMEEISRNVEKAVGMNIF